MTIKDGFQNIHVIMRMIPSKKCVNEIYWSDEFALPRNFPLAQVSTICITNSEYIFHVN